MKKAWPVPDYDERWIEEAAGCFDLRRSTRAGDFEREDWVIIEDLFAWVRHHVSASCVVTVKKLKSHPWYVSYNHEGRDHSAAGTTLVMAFQHLKEYIPSAR